MPIQDFDLPFTVATNTQTDFRKTANVRQFVALLKSTGFIVGVSANSPFDLDNTSDDFWTYYNIFLDISNSNLQLVLSYIDAGSYKYRFYVKHKTDANEMPVLLGEMDFGNIKQKYDGRIVTNDNYIYLFTSTGAKAISFLWDNLGVAYYSPVKYDKYYDAQCGIFSPSTIRFSNGKYAVVPAYVKPSSGEWDESRYFPNMLQVLNTSYSAPNTVDMDGILYIPNPTNNTIYMAI